MRKFIICGFDSENPMEEFNITINADDTAAIHRCGYSTKTDNNTFLGCMLSAEVWTVGEVRSWSDRKSVGLGHAIVQYILHNIYGDNLWYNYVSIVMVEG